MSGYFQSKSSRNISRNGVLIFSRRTLRFAARALEASGKKGVFGERMGEHANRIQETHDANHSATKNRAPPLSCRLSKTQWLKMK